MIKQRFIHLYLPAAMLAGKQYKLNPAILLAQAAIESGWGESLLSTRFNNFFGITGYGNPTAYWNGETTDPADEGGPSHLLFRVYTSAENSFIDFARLISCAYPVAASLSFHPEAYAKEIAYSRYISEVNGDNRETYQRLLIRIEQSLRLLLPSSDAC